MLSIPRVDLGIVATRPMVLVNAVLRNAFGLGASSSTRNTARKAYETLLIDLKLWSDLKDRYGSSFFAAAPEPVP